MLHPLCQNLSAIDHQFRPEQPFKALVKAAAHRHKAGQLSLLQRAQLPAQANRLGSITGARF